MEHILTYTICDWLEMKLIKIYKFIVCKNSWVTFLFLRNSENEKVTKKAEIVKIKKWAMTSYIRYICHRGISTIIEMHWNAYINHLWRGRVWSRNSSMKEHVTQHPTRNSLTGNPFNYKAVLDNDTIMLVGNVLSQHWRVSKWHRLHSGYPL